MDKGEDIMTGSYTPLTKEQRIEVRKNNWPFLPEDRVRQISTGLVGTVWSTAAPVTNYITGDTTLYSTVMLDKGGPNMTQCWLDSIREVTVDDWELIKTEEKLTPKQIEVYSKVYRDMKEHFQPEEDEDERN